MKIRTGFFIAMAIVLTGMFFVWTSPVQADPYSITGDVTNAGDYSAIGSLWTALNGSATVTNPTGPQENGISNDYVAVTGSNGSIAYFSVSELNPNYDGNNSTANPQVVNNGSGGFNLTTNDGRNVTGITSIKVIDAYPAGTSGGNNGGVSTSVSVTAPGGISMTYNGVSALNAAGTNPAGGVTVTYNHSGSHTVNFTGPTLLSVLQNLGVNTTNYNQMITFVATDGYSTLLSMAEVAEASSSNPVLLATGASDGSINVTGNSLTDSGMDRLVITGETSPGTWVSNLDSITVETVPEPSTCWLFIPGLILVAAARKRLFCI